jgi:ATP-binding cassette subfamily B protein
MKILRLPIIFFESKRSGDILQRIEDNKRVEDFVSRSFISTFFSVITLVVFISVLLYYNRNISLIFIIGSLLSIAWTLFFVKKRKAIDYRRFSELSDNTDEIYEIVKSMPEIKLNSFEDYKAKQWKKIQNKVFHINMTSIRIDQYQSIGAEFITQTKNIFITFFSAYEVIQGHMTLGILLSIAYIIGQLNVPIVQLTTFISAVQNVSFSLARLSEIHSKKNEEDDYRHTENESYADRFKRSISIRNLSFQYGGKNSQLVLKDINVDIPIGKVTAIVGASGSGKTTLIKLLLKIYQPSQGEIRVDDTSLDDLSPSLFRKLSGVVMQDGVIFSDTIMRNIVMDNHFNEEELFRAAGIARIHDFISTLPLGYYTKVGNVGIGLSEGQKQRILISRAIYRNPEFLFLDEATSALDAENEKLISNGLKGVFENKTVVIVAHRLSTVKNADKIIVLHDGVIVETGTHSELVDAEMTYFNLIRNQLELGK